MQERQLGAWCCVLLCVHFQYVLSSGHVFSRFSIIYAHLTMFVYFLQALRSNQQVPDVFSAIIVGSQCLLVLSRLVSSLCLCCVYARCISITNIRYVTYFFPWFYKLLCVCVKVLIRTRLEITQRLLGYHFARIARLLRWNGSDKHNSEEWFAYMNMHICLSVCYARSPLLMKTMIFLQNNSQKDDENPIMLSFR